MRCVVDILEAKFANFQEPSEYTEVSKMSEMSPKKTVERSGIGSPVSGFLAPIPIACMHWLVGQLVTLSYCHSVGVSAPSRSICGPWDGWYVTVTYPQPELFPDE